MRNFFLKLVEHFQDRRTLVPDHLIRSFSYVDPKLGRNGNELFWLNPE